MKLSRTLAVALATNAVDAFRRPIAKGSDGDALAARAAEGASNDARTKRQDGYPANITDYNTVTTPGGFTIRYKEPGKAGVCETTPSVGSYSGYIDVADDMHTFFWLFESRSDPSRDPMTLWLNGGPGADSLIGLFQELGPCSITEDLQSVVNPYSWSNASNLLFISQPIGVGFSYAGENTDFGDGRVPTEDTTLVNTTARAAVAAWEVIQAFYSGLTQLDSKLTSRQFNLWTESYGGHYGPGFWDYFQGQNEAIANGTALYGTLLALNSLGIGNGLISARLQMPEYPHFAVNNTYGIKAYDDAVYSSTVHSLGGSAGCLALVDNCAAADRSTSSGMATCAEAGEYCRGAVEQPYYRYSGLGPYDIRDSGDGPAPSSAFVSYLNQAHVQNAIGVNLNYTSFSNDRVASAFEATGDYVYPDLLTDLERIVDSGTQVSLYYGDADYICNWFGGEKVSLALNFRHAEQFRAAGYAPLMVDGVEYGEVRQYGNLSFTRIYESGHEVPWYQPKASLALVLRSINLLDIATGEQQVTGTTDTTGSASATHTEAFSFETSSVTSGPAGPATEPARMTTTTAQTSTTAAAQTGSSNTKAAAGKIGAETPLVVALLLQLMWLI